MTRTEAANSNAPILLLGGGLTGLSAAQFIQSRSPETDWVLFEREPSFGGIATSESVRGYTFDNTGHWLHLRNGELREEVSKWMSGELLEIQRESRSFSRGVLTGYPFQVHLHGHDPQLVLECLKGLWTARSQRSKKGRPESFEEFILTHFGEGIAKHFLVPYNEKLWGVHPREISADWCQRFVPVPPVEQILAGAVGAKLPELGYNARFLYPKTGGIGELPRALVKQLPQKRLHASSPVEEVDPWEKRVRVGGRWHPFSRLLSSMPLPELVAQLKGCPQALEHAAEALRATPVVYLDVATKPSVGQSYHWVYLPDKGHPFYRVGVYSNAASHMAPANGSSLYVELADRDTRKGLDEVLSEAVPALVAMGLISSGQDILFVRRQIIPHAYVIYDQHYKEARAKILSFLRHHGIYSCGRYGSWVYNSMEDSMLEGRSEARRALNQLNPTS